MQNVKGNTKTGEVKVRIINASRKLAPCPKCKIVSKRHSVQTRTLHEIGLSGPVTLEIVKSIHWCDACKKHFSIPLDHIAPPSGRYTNRVRRQAVALVVRDGMILANAAKYMKDKYFVNVPTTTLHQWLNDEGFRCKKKSEKRCSMKQ